MTTSFVVVEPESFEGTPYEVAERALQQVDALVCLASTTLVQSERMVLNAQLSRNLYETPDDARANEWDSSVQRRKLDAISAQLDEAHKQLSLLARAAGYDPQNPPR